MLLSVYTSRKMITALRATRLMTRWSRVENCSRKISPATILGELDTLGRGAIVVDVISGTPHITPAYVTRIPDLYSLSTRRWKSSHFQQSSL